jgi:D-glycero-alpha-D-manno-heptose-7-phosphate kinase
VDEFGQLLHEGWRLKRSMSDVSLPAIDEAYDLGRRAGATGGKLLGAGRGGFLLFVAAPETHDEVLAALGRPAHLRFGINAPGSRVIFAQNGH